MLTGVYLSLVFIQENMVNDGNFCRCYHDVIIILVRVHSKYSTVTTGILVGELQRQNGKAIFHKKSPPLHCCHILSPE